MTTQNRIINRDLFISMLSTTRPAQSVGEREFAGKIVQLCNTLGHEPSIDEHGNITVNNLPPSDDTGAKIMWTSHTDSVHRTYHAQGQELAWYDKEKTLIGLSPKEPNPQCLGADCATGVYIMLRMLEQGVKGLYCFFVQEEIGGVGSSKYADDNGEWLKSVGITHCISFDRKDYHSIITHQSFGQTASDEFALEFGDMLRVVNPSITMFADDTGTFTDSANFTPYVSECTNISVGYFKQHTVSEMQNVQFADDLADCLAKCPLYTLKAYRPIGDHHADIWRGSQTDWAYAPYYNTLYQIKQGGYDYAMELVLNDPEHVAELLEYISLEM